jgi:DnaJ homolog subfamily A member 5
MKKKATEESEDENDCDNEVKEELTEETPNRIKEEDEAEKIVENEENLGKEKAQNELKLTKNQDESESKISICSVCKEEFQSRNRLFEHIKEEGHAALKETQSTKNSKKTSKKSNKKK